MTQTMLIHSADEVYANRHQHMPELLGIEYEALKESIRQNGVMVSVILDGNHAVVDGHHRLQAFRELTEEGHDVPPVPAVVRDDLEDEEDIFVKVLELNMQRRNLSAAQRRDKAEELVRRSTYPDESGRVIYERGDNWVARLCAVDRKTVQGVRKKLVREKVIEDYTHTLGADGKLYDRERLQAASKKATGQQSKDHRGGSSPVNSESTPNDPNQIDIDEAIEAEKNGDMTVGEGLKKAGVSMEDAPERTLHQRRYHESLIALHRLLDLDPEELAEACPSPQHARSALIELGGVDEWIASFLSALGQKTEPRLKAVE